MTRTTAALLAVLGCCFCVQATARTDADKADAAIRAFVAQHRIPSAHVTIVRGDNVILQRGYGSLGSGRQAPDASSIFPLGSISKQFTAALILALAEDGRVQLDAPVATYLPEWFSHELDLRVWHLLAQSSGLPDFLWLKGYRALADNAGTPIEAFLTLAASAPRRFPPGTRWAYSNTNYKALALIAERATQRPFDELLSEFVTRPAGIDGVASCHGLEPDLLVPGVAADGKPTPLDASAAAYVGDGGLCGNARSLTKWIRAALASTEPRFVRLRAQNQLSDGTVVPYGFGVSTRPFLGNRMVWHGGNVDSHSTMIAYLPAEDLGLVILTSKGLVWLTELLPALLGVAPPQRGATSDEPPAGRFEDGLFRYVLTPAGSSLRVKIDLIDTLDFVPAGGREYIAERFPATFRIRLPVDGSRDRFEIEWGEFRAYARRSKD